MPRTPLYGESGMDGAKGLKLVLPNGLNALRACR